MSFLVSSHEAAGRLLDRLRRRGVLFEVVDDLGRVLGELDHDGCVGTRDARDVSRRDDVGLARLDRLLAAVRVPVGSDCAATRTDEIKNKNSARGGT